ncbi:MAG TPA: type IV pilus biogenesis/stability protein PilW [Noviherbaspirillum sp.]
MKGALPGIRLACLPAVLLVVILVNGCASNPQQDVEQVTSASEQSDDQRRARIRLQLAVGYYQQRQFPVALEELRVALQADPRLADAYSMRGLIQMEMGEDRLAEESFKQALKLVPGDPDYNNNYGWFLCQGGRARESIPYFQAALKNRSYQSPAKAYRNAGVCSLKLNDVKAAEDYFTQAFQLEPADTQTNFNLADLHYKQRDYQRAHFYIGRVLKAEVMTAEALWLGLRIERKLGDRGAESSLATQLRRRHPASPEFAAYQRGAFDE